MRALQCDVLPEICSRGKVSILAKSPERRVCRAQVKCTEGRIAFALKQPETGTSVAEATRKMGFTEQTFYRWKKKYGDLGATELRRLRQIEEENRKLKLMVADLSLDKHMLQEVIQKKL